MIRNITYTETSSAMSNKCIVILDIILTQWSTCKKSKIVHLPSVDNPVYFLPVVFNVRKPDWLIFVWLFVARVPIYTIVVIWNTKDTVSLFLEVSVRFHIFCVLFLCISPYWHENHTNTTSRSAVFYLTSSMFVDMFCRHFKRTELCRQQRTHPTWLTQPIDDALNTEKEAVCGRTSQKGFLAA